MSNANTNYDKQHPGYFALLAALVFMAVGPVALMFVNSFKLDVDILSGTSGLLFLPTIKIMKQLCAMYCHMSLIILISAR